MRECKNCGATLDPQESCDCEQNKGKITVSELANRLDVPASTIRRWGNLGFISVHGNLVDEESWHQFKDTKYKSING